MALDMIEPAALPPVPPAALRLVFTLIGRQRRGGGGKPRLHRFEASRQRIVDGDEATFLRQIERQCDADEIASLIRERGRRRRTVLNVRSIRALDAESTVEPLLIQLIGGVFQASDIEQRASPLARERQLSLRV